MPQRTFLSRIGTNCGCLPKEDLDGTFSRASTGHTARLRHRCDSISHFSVSSRGDCGRHEIQLWRRSCSRSTRAGVRDPLSSIVSRQGGWRIRSSLASFKRTGRATAGQVFDRGAHCLGGDHLVWQLRRVGARIVFEGSARLRLFEVRVQNCWCAPRAVLAWSPRTMNLTLPRQWRNCKALLANSKRSEVKGTPVKMACQTFLERLHRFGTCFCKGLVHLGAEATTPAHWPKLRVVQP